MSELVVAGWPSGAGRTHCPCRDPREGTTCDAPAKDAPSRPSVRIREPPARLFRSADSRRCESPGPSRLTIAHRCLSVGRQRLWTFIRWQQFSAGSDPSHRFWEYIGRKVRVLRPPQTLVAPFSPRCPRTSVARVLNIPGPPNRVSRSLTDWGMSTTFSQSSTTSSFPPQAGSGPTVQPSPLLGHPCARPRDVGDSSENARYVR